jgi:exoribonuclease R
MAGGSGRQRGRGPNRQNKGKNRGPKGKGRGRGKGKAPQLHLDERLWRRLVPHFRADDWERSWTGDAIAALLTKMENPTAGADSESKTEHALLSEVNEALAEGRKTGTYVLKQKDGSVRFRTLEAHASMEQQAAEWKDFFSRHAAKGDAPLSGRPPLCEPDVGADDVARYRLLEDVWEALLTGNPLPAAYSLDGEGCTRLLGFDLVAQATKCAARRTGLRTHRKEPPMALLMLASQRWTARGLLDARLEARRREGLNTFPRTYDAGLVAYADRLPEVDGEGEVAAGRTDLRHLPFVTIDPPDAKDFDDAVCLVTENGVRTLWVAIADVAHYVKIGTSLDAAASNRATSVYLPHTVLPMLPPRLADDLCSLRAEVDRLAMVVAMTLDDDDTVVETKAYEAVIQVKKNIAYADVLSTDAYADMLALAATWQAREIRLNLNNPELRPRLHGDEALHVEVKWPNDATRMIESFMVATNAAVGHLLGAAGAPLPWRCHAPPDRPEVEELNAKLTALEINIQLPMPSLRKHGETAAKELSNLLGDWANLGGGGIDLSGFDDGSTEDEVPDYLSTVIDPDAREGILTSLQDAQAEASGLQETKRRIVDHGLFRLMQRANYSEENGGHFGLNLDAYVHFTSPIRRYPDLMTHRQLKAYIHGEDWAHDLEETATLSQHCTDQGLLAKRMEWELVANAYHLHLLRGGRLGEAASQPAQEGTQVDTVTTYNARVVGMHRNSVFLDLADDGAVSGRMNVNQLGTKERLTVDEFGLRVITAEPDVTGEHRTLMTLGQRFRCRIRGLDVWSGSLDLAPL